MKKSFLGVICALALATATSVIAGPAFSNTTVSVTETNSVVTPDLGTGKATSVRILNDGSSVIAVDFDRVAVFDAETAVRIGPCEGREFLFDSAGITTVNIISDTGETSTARVEVHNMKGIFPQGYPSVIDRVKYIENKGCTAAPEVLLADDELAAIAGLTSAADKGIQFTGSGTAATFTLTTAAKTVLDDATVSAMLDTLGGASATGSGGVVRATSPTLVTPVLGVGTYTSLASSLGKVVPGSATLTEAGGAEVVATVVSATTKTFSVRLLYSVTATDATDYAASGGEVSFSCVNVATVVTCSAPSSTDETDSLLASTNSKTLTYAIAINVATANQAKLTFNIDSDMTVSAASIRWTAIVNGEITSIS